MSLLGLLGYIIASYITYRVCRATIYLLFAIVLYRVIPKFRKQPRCYSQIKDRWVAITGCTDGIGRVFATELVNYGFTKFLLVARNELKLKDVASNLQNSGAEAKYVVFDFAKDDFNQLVSDVQLYDIGFLINNVGMGPDVLRKFGDQVDLNRQMIKVNTISAMEMMHAVLPQMKQHKSGVIINVSSSQAMRPIPYLSSYSATKAATLYLSTCVHQEYKSNGISVQCFIPLLIATKMTKYKNGGLFVVTPEEFVKDALSTVGYRPLTAGCFNHEIQFAFMYLVPWLLLSVILKPLYAHHRRRMEKGN